MFKSIQSFGFEVELCKFYIGFFQLSKAENRNLNENKATLDQQFINNDTVWSILKFAGVQTKVSIMFQLDTLNPHIGAVLGYSV